MIGISTKDSQSDRKMVTLVQIVVLCVFISMIFVENGNAFVIDQDEDLRTMFQQSEKTDYFGAIERVTPVVYRVSKNSSESPKEISPQTTRLLPKIVDFALQSQKRSLSMRLHRMVDVIGSHTRVEWTAEGGITESKVLSNKCVYHGKVDGMENSLATIDLCNDLKGVIRTDDEDIYLQPITQSTGRHGDQRTYKETDTGENSETHIIRVHPRQTNRPIHFPEVSSINLTSDTSQMDDADDRTNGANDGGSSSRAKRQALHRGPRHMQVLLVTDGSLVRFHGRDLIDQYLLTQMSIVRHLVSTGDGKTSLDRFCQWANEEKPKNKNKDEDFDVAVYITKEEIGPAGYAPVTGMCNPVRSCALVKDDGTSSAFVIAHEIGHIFGMIHDGHGNDCSDDPSDGKIMASMVQSNYHTYYWSRCNKVAMEKYLVDIHCLDDKPKDPSWPVYSQPFGQSWSLDEQCRQEFGSGFSLCRAFDHLDPCHHLWCSHSSNETLCKTKRGPPLPGTSCGRGKWCMHGSCLEKRTVSVDGGWSHWQRWEACSRTCGIGMQFRVRSCTQPSPKHGGADCRGDREEFRTCNTQPCSQLKDIREEQCMEFNEKRFDQGRRHHWLPVDNQNATEMCKMTCVSRDTGAMFVSESNAIDGTFCSYDLPHQVCVKGTCHSVGCDGVLNSRQRDDQCGQCGGNGSTCKRVTGVITELLSRKEYHRILIVPAKARNIAIRELHSTHLAHFIAVRDTATERWYLNGNTQQGPSKQFVAHGTSFTYSTKQREGESLTAKGPLLAPIDIMIYSMSTKLPPALDYEYTIPPEVTQKTYNKVTSTGVESELSRYVWAVSGWTNCSKPCGSGFNHELFTCVDTEKRQFSDGFCSFLSKPNGARKDCNTHPCGLYTYWWDADDWSDVESCSASCGFNGYQQRRVQCVTDNRGQTKAIEPYYCNQRTMPTHSRPCNRFACTTPEDLPSTSHWVSTTTEGGDVVSVRTGSDWSSSSITTPETTSSWRATTQRYPVAEGVVTPHVSLTDSGIIQSREEVSSTEAHNTAAAVTETRVDSTTESSSQATARSKHITTTLLGVLTSTTLPTVHKDTVVAISRQPLHLNRLEGVPVRGSSSTNGVNAGQSTRASTFKNEASELERVFSSTARTVSLEEEGELFIFGRSIGEATPRIGASYISPSFEAEETDDFSSSSESDIELGLVLGRKSLRNGDQGPNFPRSTTSGFVMSPSFLPVDQSVTRISRIESQRFNLHGQITENEEGRQGRNNENEKAAYGREILVTSGSMREATRTTASISRTLTSPTVSSTSTTATTTTTKAPTSTTRTTITMVKTSTITKAVPTPTTATPTSTTAATTKHTTATTIAVNARATAPTRKAISTTPTTTNGIPSSTTADTKAPTSTTRSIIEAAISTDPVVTSRLEFTKSGTSQGQASRQLKAKTTVRKHARKHSNSHAHPEPSTQTIQDEDVPRLKMIAVESRPRASFPRTEPPPLPYSDCSSDRSMLFCQAGANQDRCSNPTFHTLCCVSCRVFLVDL